MHVLCSLCCFHEVKDKLGVGGGKVFKTLPLPSVTTATLTPESSPLGVLSPAATTAAVSMAMNGAKRMLSSCHGPSIADTEPEVKRQKLLQQQNIMWSNNQTETSHQDKL